MEIDITGFFLNVDTWPLSGSIATHGQNVAKNTWSNAKRKARKSPLLKTKNALGAMRRWAKETGAWSREEIAAWSPEEVNALFIQLVSGDMREAGLDGDPDEIDWETHEKESKETGAGSNLFKGTDDRIYYYLGN